MSLDDLFNRITNEVGKDKNGSTTISDKEEKLLPSHLKELYRRSKLKFIVTYKEFITPNDLKLFYVKENGEMEDDNYISRINVAHSKKNIDNEDVEVKNGRWIMYENLCTNSDFFSNRSMREREPDLFDSMVGRFLSDYEKDEIKPSPINNGFSGVMTQFVDSEIICERKGRNDDMMKLYEEVVIKGNVKALDGEDEKSNTSKDVEKNEDDKEFLRTEFLTIMRNRFINGDDKEYFDYSSYKLDDKKKINRMKEIDIEEDYFNDD
uniref:DUF2052 domain-containing protein n=1 Tax=Parastrongyloides trichosuri TaxID=131310 RepID=A0A0N4ZDJ5_PARTI